MEISFRRRRDLPDPQRRLGGLMGCAAQYAGLGFAQITQDCLDEARRHASEYGLPFPEDQARDIMHSAYESKIRHLLTVAELRAGDEMASRNIRLGIEAYRQKLEEFKAPVPI